MSIGGGEGEYGGERSGVAGSGMSGRTRTRPRLADDDVVDAYDAPRRPPVRMGRSVVTVMGVVILLIAAIAFANRGGGDSPAGTGAPEADAPRPTAPTGERPVRNAVGGIPTGFPRTEQGAQSAAANYAVALGGTGMFNTGRRHEIVDTVYAPDTAARIKELQDKAYSESFLDRLGLDAEGEATEGRTFVSRTVPVGTTVTEYTDDSATVEVWYTGLIGMAGEESTRPVTTTWKTWTFELRWTGSDWKITEDSQEDGPAPVPGDVPASTADDISKAVEEYGGFTYAR